MRHQEINSQSGHYSGTLFENKSFDLHFHATYELVYMEEGMITAEFAGTRTDIKKGEFLLISPCVAHSFVATGQCRYFITIFPKEYVESFFNKESEEKAFHFSVNNEILKMYLKHLYKEKEEDKYMIISSLYAMCSCALKNNILSSSQKELFDFVFEVNKILSLNFKEDLKRKDVADKLNYEEHYFSTLFSKNFNINFKTYLNNIRIEYAKNLLRSTKMSIMGIAIDSGFKSIRNFNTSFKSYTGVIPSEYRKRISSKEGEKRKWYY